MTEKKIVPKCKFGKTSYFSSEGRWLPCCSFPHLGPQLKESIFSRDEFLMENNTEFNTFHEKEVFKLWIDHIENNYENNLWMCKSRCSQSAHDLQKSKKFTTWVLDEQVPIKSMSDLHQFLEDNEIEYDFDELTDET